jgi:hypothetical protein
MSFRARVVWNRDPRDLGRAVTEYGERLVYHALVQYLEKNAGEIAEQMRREAVWQDQTGEARRLLSAEVRTSGAAVELYLSHGVDYGKWLELANGGRYAIVGPTVSRAGIQIMNDLKGKMRQ